MGFSRDNALDQELDIAGSFNQVDTLTLTDESACLGAPLAGQTGVVASIAVGAVVTLTGLTGMTVASEGGFLEITGAVNPGNNGTFLISSFISAVSVEIINALAVAEGVGFTWVERLPYSLEDDLNYERTDRSAIKGVGYDQPIPTYTRCTDTVTLVPADLSNIAGKTTDAKAFVTNRAFGGVVLTAGTTFVTLSNPGNLRHSDSVNRTGIPINDGADAGDFEATYVEFIDGYSSGLFVLGGAEAGNRVFGRTRAGATTSPNAVEVEFRSAPDGYAQVSVPYTWEVGQPTSLDMYYGYRSCIDDMDENAFRVTLVSGLVSDSGLRQNVVDLQLSVGVDDGDTDLGGLLTNTTSFFPFDNLPDVTPSVVEALNTLNEQIGDRDYDGVILTDGYTITDSLQELADAIASNTSVTRVITRAGAVIPVGSVITVPGGLSYTVDGSDNGAGMMVYWRGVLRDPGNISAGDDYEETSTTSITNLRRIRVRDHINWVIIG